MNEKDFLKYCTAWMVFIFVVFATGMGFILVDIFDPYEPTETEIQEQLGEERSSAFYPMQTVEGEELCLRF